MPESNWENLQEAFHAALAMPVAERAAFIELSSKGDESLRNALESLLKSHEETNNLLDTPAYQAAAMASATASARARATSAQACT